MSKQDRAAPRTPVDLERKYNLGHSFSEVIGYATRARSAANEATDAATAASEVAQRVEDKVDADIAAVTAKVDGAVETANRALASAADAQASADTAQAGVNALIAAKLKLLHIFTAGTAGAQNYEIPGLAGCDMVLLQYGIGTAFTNANLNYALIPIGTNYDARELLNVTENAEIQIAQRTFTATAAGVLSCAMPCLRTITSSIAAEPATNYPETLSPVRVYGFKL